MVVESQVAYASRKENIMPNTSTTDQQTPEMSCDTQTPLGQEKIAFGKGSLASYAWRLWIPRLLAGAIGLILLIAGVAKAIDMNLFIEQMRDYGIITQDVLLTLSAWGLVALECALGVGLLILYRTKLIFSLTAMLWLIFLGATSWAWLTSATEECGCFGVWLKSSPGKAFIENLVLLAATILAWLGHRDSLRIQSRAKAWSVAVAFLFGLTLPLAFGFRVSRIEQSPWKTMEAELSRLQIQGLDSVDLSRGAHLIVLMDTECEHCLDVMPELNALAEATESPAVIALCISEESKRRMFIEKFQPRFPIGQIKEDAFLRLLGYGDLPRIILFQDQHVGRVWDKSVPNKDMFKMDTFGGKIR